MRRRLRSHVARAPHARGASWGARTLLLSIALFALAAPRTAMPCSCVPPPLPLDALAQADAVFLGRVVDLDGPYPVRVSAEAFTDSDRHFRIEVLAAWKGVTQREVVVRTGSGGGDCGYDFSLNGVYLVYAYARGMGPDTVATSICSRTRPVEEAEEDRQELGSPAVDRLHGVAWSTLAAPIHCPVHPAFRIRDSHTWPLMGLSEEAARAWAAMGRVRFPYSAVQVDRPGPGTGGSGARSLTRSRVCPACREGAMEWGYAHGAYGACTPPPGRAAAADAPAMDTSATGRAARALSDAAYRQLHPQRNFAFLYEDGRRLNVDTIENRMSREYVTMTDTTVKLSLAEPDLDRIYAAMVKARIWDLPAGHPAYPGLRAGEATGPCSRVRLYARSDTLVTMLEWTASRLPRRLAAAGADWAQLAAVIDAIESAVHASPEWRALPPFVEPDPEN